MVKNNLTPWSPRYAIIVTIGTVTELTRYEKKIIEKAFSKYSPHGPYPSITEIVEEVRRTDPYLASEIIIPD